MTADIAQALAGGGLIDITTTGRRTGQPRRIEIVAHVIDGHVYISGMTRRQRRSWLANLEAEPRLIVHLKHCPVVDLPARARIVTDETERRVILADVARRWKRTDLDVMVAWSPLIEVVPADAAA